MPRYQPDPLRMPNVWASTSSYRPRRRTYSDDWFGPVVKIVVGIVVIIAVFALAAACTAQADDDFAKRCTTQHPGARMDKVNKYAYKSYTTTRYCLGPEGQVWMIE